MDLIEDERASLERHLLKTAEIKKIKKLGILCVIAGFFCNFTVFGVSFTYGIFQEFYLSKKGPLFGVEPAKVAIIGTIATSITYMGGALQPQIRKHFSSFTSMFIGSILLSFGMIIASWCHETWQFAMTQGLMFGIGSSLVYMPPIVYCPQLRQAQRSCNGSCVFGHWVWIFGFCISFKSFDYFRWMEMVTSYFGVDSLEHNDDLQFFWCNHIQPTKRLLLWCVLIFKCSNHGHFICKCFAVCSSPWAT